MITMCGTGWSNDVTAFVNGEPCTNATNLSLNDTNTDSSIIINDCPVLLSCVTPIGKRASLTCTSHLIMSCHNDGTCNRIGW